MGRLEIAATVRTDLGEAPVWDAAESCLWFVDIASSTVCRFDIPAGTVATERVGQPIGAAIPRTDGGLALALADGLHLMTWGGEGPQRAIAMDTVDDPAEGGAAAAAINTVQLISAAFGAGLAGVVVNTAEGGVIAARWLFTVFAVISAAGVVASYGAIRGTRHSAR